MGAVSNQRRKIMSDAANIDHSKKRPSHVAYTVQEGKEGKSYWNRCGVAWATKDGKGFTIQLNAIPLDGKIVLRIPENNS
jgi:hypothetical protein